MFRAVIILGGVWIALATAVAVAQPPLLEPKPPVVRPAPLPPYATPPANSNSPSNGPLPPGGILESKLGPIYVRDQAGSLLVYPSITLEEIDRLKLLEQQRRTVEPPRFQFGPGTTITGTVADSAVDLVLTFQVQRLESSLPQDEWVRIALRMNQTVLVPPTAHEGPGEFLFEFDPQRDGYVLWLKAPPGSEHTFTVQFKAPLLRKNGARQLMLKTPETPTNLRLSGVGRGADARVNVNAGNILSTRRTAAGPTELVVDAAGGDIDLTWRDLEEVPPVMAAFGNISVSLSGRQLAFDTQLNVRSYGPAIDSFIVRLPPGTELIATNQFTQPGLEYSPVPNSDKSNLGRQYLVHRTEGKTSGPIEARLRCETTGDILDSANPWQIAGFEVLGARHQKGVIDFHVEGDWSIDWQTDANVRRIDDLPDVLRQQKLAARFEYDRQPFSLRTTVREKETRVTVEPTWLVSVAAQRMTLEGVLKYRMSGARPKPLKFETNGWKIEQIAPSELIGGDWLTDATTLTVPISAGVQSRGGEFELRLLGSRDHLATGLAAAAAARLPRGLLLLPPIDSALPPLGPAIQLLSPFHEQLGDITFRLPRPITEAGLPALAVISPEDNIELRSSADRLRGLVNDTLPAEVKVTPRQQQPLVYREDVGGQAAEFVGQFRVRPQTIAVTVESRLRVEERETIIEQRFLHTIAYEPTSVLRFMAPRGLVDVGRFELLVDGVAATWARQPMIVTGDSTHVPILVELRDPRIGSCEVVFRYRIPRHPTGPNASPSEPTIKVPGELPAEFMVPLIQVPADDTISISSHRLRIAEAANMSATPVSRIWSLVEEEGADRTSGWTVFHSAESPTTVELAVTLESTLTKRSTELLRVWVQSLLTARERRDRACFRLTTNEQALTFNLPAGANLDVDDVTVAVDGRRTYRFAISPQGKLRVELGELFGARETTIELWYWFPVQAVPLGRVLLQSPQLADVSRTERAYWELVVPRNEHLAWYDLELTSENAWDQRQFLWSRRSVRSTSELEDWISGSHQPDLAEMGLVGFNRYLFSSLGTLSPKTVYTVTRPFAVLIVGGVVLWIGAMLLYLPSLRHPLLLLAAGVTTAGAAVAFPAPALAAAQLVVMGLVLVLTTGLLRALLARPVPRQSRPRPSIVSPPDSRSSKSPQSRSMALNSHITTTTLQGAAPVSATGPAP